MTLLRTAGIWALLTVMLAGCSALSPRTPEDAGGSEAIAKELVMAWAAAVRGAAPDRGWRYIHPGSRQVIGGEAAYDSAAEKADWSLFALEVTGVTLVDGQYRVTVRVQNARAVPTFVTDWNLIQLDAGATGVMILRIAPAGGPSGILAG